jgi:hypothetical protein
LATANLITIGTFPTTQAQRELFRSGILMKEWAEKYPDIFDAEDANIDANQPDYHFYEWLAAVLLWESLGYLSLVEKYQFKRHKRQQDILRQYLPTPVFELVTNHTQEYGGVQAPDLFVYSPKSADWFFCEVKGPRDRIRAAQSIFFGAICRQAQRPIYMMKFTELRIVTGMP